MQKTNALTINPYIQVWWFVAGGLISKVIDVKVGDSS